MAIARGQYKPKKTEAKKPVVLITDFTVEFGLSSTEALYLPAQRAHTDIRRPAAQ
jgi:hypothetical protein